MIRLNRISLQNARTLALLFRQQYLKGTLEFTKILVGKHCFSSWKIDKYLLYSAELCLWIKKSFLEKLFKFEWICNSKWQDNKVLKKVFITVRELCQKWQKLMIALPVVIYQNTSSHSLLIKNKKITTVMAHLRAWTFQVFKFR